MLLKDMIRQKRKECGLTQEQVAERLGVSAPAVNKWESGSTCPDISLLAPLARLFHTDLNTLLCFRENLTKEDIAGYMNEAAKLAQAEGAAAALARVKEIVKEYPSNGELLYQMGTMLRGIALMQAGSPEQVREQFDYSRELYEQAAVCGDIRAADKARHALASMYIQDDEYEKAEELISLLPEDTTLDKKSLEISMLMKQGKNAEASALLEQSLNSAIQKVNIHLNLLASAAVREGDRERAWELARYSAAVMEIYGWKYYTCLTAWTVAMEEKDARKSMELLREMLESLPDAQVMRKSLLFAHLPVQDGEQGTWKQLGRNLIMAMNREEEFAFLKDSEEFQELVKEYS